MQEELKIGDDVCRKTGGPVMKLNAFDDGHGAYCVWEERGERQTGRFRTGELQRAADKSEEKGIMESV